MDDIRSADLERRLDGLNREELRELALMALEASGLEMDDIEDFLQEEFEAADLQDSQEPGPLGEDEDGDS